LNIFSLYGYLDPVPDPSDVAPNYLDPYQVGKNKSGTPLLFSHHVLSLLRKKKWYGVRRLAVRQHQIPSVPLTIGSNDVIPVSTVRDRGIYIDSDISMRTHVAKTVPELFCRSTTDALHQAVRFKACPAVTGRVNGLDTTGLRQRDTGWSSTSSDGQTTVGYQPSSTVGVLCTEIRSYNTTAP